MKKFKSALMLATLVTLTACGGGGSGAGNDTLYPLSAALTEYVSNTSTTNVILTGSISNAGQTYAISGTGMIVENTISNTIFNGITAKKKSQTTTGSITLNGVSQPINDTAYYYFDNNNRPLGFTNASAYCISFNVKSIPMNSLAGQSGDWYTTDCYTNSSKAVKIGSTVTSYQIKAVTDKSADLIINQITTDSSGTITAPSKLVYRMNMLGDVTFREQSTSIDYSGSRFLLTITAN
jgi:hypothetical protein